MCQRTGCWFFAVTTSLLSAVIVRRESIHSLSLALPLPNCCCYTGPRRRRRQITNGQTVMMIMMTMELKVMTIVLHTTQTYTTQLGTSSSCRYFNVNFVATTWKVHQPPHDQSHKPAIIHKVLHDAVDRDSHFISLLDCMYIVEKDFLVIKQNYLKIAPRYKLLS